MRAERKTSRIGIVFGFILSASVGLVALPATGEARTFNLNSTNTGVVNDSLCGLREAIQAVNTQAAYSGCAAGNGNDVIILGNNTYTVTATLYVTKSVEIRGNGWAVSKIQSNLSSGTELFNFLPPSQSGNQTFILTNATLIASNSQPAPQVTGIYAYGGLNASYPSIQISGSNIGNFTWSGIAAEGANVKVTDSFITSNYSPDAGAGITVTDSGNNSAGLNVFYSTVAYNNSDTLGGGIFYGGYGNSHIEESTVTGNSAYDGGGVAIQSETYLEINQSTITQNYADDGGGGIRAVSNGPTPVNGSIVAGNSAPTGPDVWGTLTGLQDSLIGNTTGMQANTGTHNLLDVDPHLDPVPADLGGSYHTYVHRLLPGSPAIDFNLSYDGSATANTGDQRHYTNPVDGDGVAGPNLFDIGAYEHDPRWQNEELIVNSASVTNQKVADSHYSNGAAMNLVATAANASVVYILPIAAAGSYNVRLGVSKRSNAGKVQVSSAGSAAGPFTNIGSPLDLYSSTASYSELSVASGVSLPAGQRYVKFTVTGKNSSSSSYQLFLDYIKLQ